MKAPRQIALTALLLTVIAIVACDRHAANPASRASQVVQAGAPAWYLDSAEGCGFVRAQVYADPTELVRHYVALDSAGVFLASTPVMDTVYLCAGHLPGPDAFTVVKHTEVRLLSQSDTAALVLASSLSLGTVTSDTGGNSYLIPNLSRVVDTFHLTRTVYGWRIETPQLPDRVSPLTVLDRANEFHVRQDALDSIRAFISRPEQPG